MSVAGFKKQFYKATQLMSEKVGGAEGTKLDEDFKELERRADVTSKAYMEVIGKTSEYLQPNPTTRAKLAMLNTMSKIRGASTSLGYTQPEGVLGECMTKYGGEMGSDNNFGAALVEVGEAMKQMSEVKNSLDFNVKQNFIDPLQAVADKDLKEIQHYLKKLEGHRLDYDYKKKRQGKIPDEEIKQALEKFHNSKEMAESSMHNLLETDVEQVTQLYAFVESMLDYHRQVSEILASLSSNLKERVNEAQSRPKSEYTPKPRPSFDYGQVEDSNGGYSSSASSPTAYSPASAQYSSQPFQRSSVKSKQSEPCCKALYDFEPENDGELGFREGDIITLVSQIDENWFEGSLHGKSGYFPNNYVEVVVPLSH